MYAAGSGISVPSSVSATIVDISSDLFSGLSDGSVYEIDTGTDQFKINENGIYLATISVAMGIGGAPAANSYAAVTFDLTDDHGAGLLEGTIQPWANLPQVALGGSIPLNIDSGGTFSDIALTQTSGLTANVQIEMMVVRLSASPLTLS